jgi:predicted nucleic acid-binding protein
MNALLLDTNVVSILFNRNHSLRQTCIDSVAGHQLVVSFMTRAELLLWPATNNWGATRRGALGQHLALYLTLYPDERTCTLWSEVVDQCRRAGQPVQAADAWIASAVLQWNCPLVTTDFRDFAAIDGLDVVPIR